MDINAIDRSIRETNWFICFHKHEDIRDAIREYIKLTNSNTPINLKNLK